MPPVLGLSPLPTHFSNLITSIEFERERERERERSRVCVFGFSFKSSRQRIRRLVKGDGGGTNPSELQSESVLG